MKHMPDRLFVLVRKNLDADFGLMKKKVRQFEKPKFRETDGAVM